jgi:hypothetical protein
MTASILECRLINASIAAYCIRDRKLPTNSAGYGESGIKAGTIPTIFSGGTDEIDSGYRSQAEDHLLFHVFRGTLPPASDDFWQSIDDWLNDLRIEPMPCSIAGGTLGQAETGSRQPSSTCGRRPRPH